MQKPYNCGVNTISFIAARLRELRKRNGLTQERVAELAKIGYKYYQLLESGRKRHIWVDTVERLAAVHEVALHEFFAPEMLAVAGPDGERGKPAVGRGRRVL